MPADEIVDCKTHACTDGSQHIVFTVRGTDKCVGEVRITGDDRYLLCIAQMIQQWALNRTSTIVRPNRHLSLAH
jgi:hypothetical protein